MKNIFILINHILTERQLAQLHEIYGSECKIIFPPENVKIYWSQIPPKTTLENEKINQITKWLSQAKEQDVLLVQGDFGATFVIVDYALKNNLIPIQSVTKRIETEEKDGEKVYKHYVFEHECFREYKYWENL